MPPKKPLFDHTFYPALAVILAICVAVGVYAFSVWPTEQELSPTSTTVIKHKKGNTNNATNTNTSTDVTKGWKIYTNKTYGYTMNYPVTWTMSDALGTKTIQFIPPDASKKTSMELSPAVFVSADQAYNEHQLVPNASHSSSDLFSNWRTVVINGVSVKRQYEGGMGESDVAYLPTISGKYIAISWDIGFVKDYPQYEQILSSFIFTSPTADWKTYTNTANKISFKYPAEWTVVTNNLVPPATAVASTGQVLTLGVKINTTTVRPELQLWVNPAFGPPTPTKVFTLARSGNGYAVTKETATTLTSDFPLPTYYTIHAADPSNQTSPRLFMAFTSGVAGTTDPDFDVTIKQILSTFTFTK